MAQQITMEKVSNRIWVLLAGIAVAIAIAISALAFEHPESTPQASDPYQTKTKAITAPAILLKKIYHTIEFKIPRSN